MIRFAVVVVLMVVSSAARAQPAGAQAEVLFREGRDLMKAGKYAEACAAFEQSQKLESAVTTLLNLAGCREKAGQLATAWGLFLEAERQTRDQRPDAMRKLHDVAKTRARSLEPRVSTLTINVPLTSQVDGLEILRDIERLDPVMWNRALPVDGGTYTVSARSPGASTWTTQVTVAPERDIKTVDIPDLRNLPRDLAKAPPPATPISPPVREDEGDEEPPSTTAEGSSKVLPIAVGVGATALLGGAIGFHLWGNARYDAAKAEVNDQARRNALYDAANQKRYIATGLGIAGVAAAGVSVFLLVRGDRDGQTTAQRSSPPRRQLALSPSGISLMGTF